MRPTLLVAEPVFRLLILGSIVVVTIFFVLLVVLFVRESRAGRLW